jgi:hypothetical protein
MIPPGRRSLLGMILLLTTLGAIAFAIYLSLDPRNYFFHREDDRASWAYDPLHIVFVTGLMLAESGCASGALLLPRPRPIWLRCLIGLLVLVPGALAVTPFVIHMPAHVIVHHLWLWLLIVLLILVTVGSMLRQLLARLRRGRLTGRLSGPA